MAENQIDYIEIPARDPAEARSFFEQLFGWQFEDYGPDYVSFADDHRFHFTDPSGNEYAVWSDQEQ